MGHFRRKLLCFQYFSCKLLKSLQIAIHHCARKFLLESRKILFSKNLAGGVSHEALQNLEPLALIRKILRNKHLAAARRSRPSPLGVHMMGYLGCVAQGQMSQR